IPPPAPRACAFVDRSTATNAWRSPSIAHALRARREMALRPVEINTSHWDSTLEQREDGTFAVRLVSARNGPKRLQRRRDGCFSSIEQLRRMKGGERVKIAGAVLIRQRPGKDTAIFITLEDESGIANIVLWASQIDRFRRAVMASQLMQV